MQRPQVGMTMRSGTLDGRVKSALWCTAGLQQAEHTMLPHSLQKLTFGNGHNQVVAALDERVVESSLF